MNNNTEQIRAFFRKLTDSLGTKPNSQTLEVLHNSTALGRGLQHSSNQKQKSPDLQTSSTTRDFGVGLPPLANC